MLVIFPFCNLAVVTAWDGMVDGGDKSYRFCVIVYVRGKFSVCFLWFLSSFLLRSSGKVDVFLCVCVVYFGMD